MRTNRLGRGLEALIPQASSESGRNEEVFEVEVARVRVNPRQPRLDFDPERMAQLKQSIAEHGVIQPITVRKIEDGYELIAGERRLRAVIELGYERIPAFLLEVESEDKLLELALIENIQREDLNAIEVAQAYHRLMQEYGLTQEEVARKVGKDRATVANFVRLLKLPEPIQASLMRDEITMGHARALMGLESRADQMTLWKKILRYQLSVRQVEEAVRRLSTSEARANKGKASTRDPHLVEIEDRFRSALGSRVTIRSSGKGGKIEISYYSREDLDRIAELIEGIAT